MLLINYYVILENLKLSLNDDFLAAPDAGHQHGSTAVPQQPTGSIGRVYGTHVVILIKCEFQALFENIGHPKRSDFERIIFGQFYIREQPLKNTTFLWETLTHVQKAQRNFQRPFAREETL